MCVYSKKCEKFLKQIFSTIGVIVIIFMLGFFQGNIIYKKWVDSIYQRDIRFQNIVEHFHNSIVIDKNSRFDFIKKNIFIIFVWCEPGKNQIILYICVLIYQNVRITGRHAVL